MMLGRRSHKALLALHITASTGWIGALVAYLALDVTTVASDDVTLLRASYVAMDSITTLVIIPIAWTGFVTGIAIAAGSRWGLFRHYWVVISLVLTAIAVLVLMIEASVISALAEIAVDPATTDGDLRALPSTLVHSVGGLLILLTTQVLNIYKPRGMTPYGRRRRSDG